MGKRKSSTIEWIRTCRNIYGKALAQKELKRLIKSGEIKRSTGLGYARKLGMKLKRKKRTKRRR